MAEVEKCVGAAAKVDENYFLACKISPISHVSDYVERNHFFNILITTAYFLFLIE